MSAAAEIIADISGAAQMGASLLNVRQYSGLTADSRKVVRGGLFAALKGAEADGRSYADQAVQAGAAAILTDLRPLDHAWGDNVQVIQHQDPRATLATMAAAYYGVRPDTAALVTGSSGKTSTVEFARQLWQAIGRPAASIGTLGVVAPGAKSYGGLTSPDPVAMMAALAKLAGAGVSAVAIEASSHGLDQSRLDGIQAEIGAFTSFSRDHLDYHGDEQSYLNAKLRLFREVLAPGASAVICADMKSADQAIAAANLAGHAVLSYGRSGQFLKLTGLHPDGFGQVMEITHPEGITTVRLDHFAGFQAENALAAAGIVIAGGASIADTLAAIEGLAQPPGRMQRAAVTASGAPIYVDYSHKPDALKQALAALNRVVTGNVTVVFGCGGDRDTGKRPIMGAIAASGADRVIVTDDNPRSEDPASIRQAILEAAPNAEEIADRGAAIRAALEGVGPDDVVLIAGKGHEQGQIIGPLTMPFDDVEEAQAAVMEASQ